MLTRAKASGLALAPVARGLAGLACWAVLMASTPAQAFTECDYTVAMVYAGTTGEVFAYFKEGGQVYIEPSNASKDRFFSMLLTAKVSGQHVKVRFSADGGSCTVARADSVLGLWVY
jgi:hypothetical protein